MHDKGKLSKAYVVDCGKCCKRFTVFAAKQSFAEAQYRKFGFSKTKEFGWVCNKCNGGEA